MEQCFNSLNLRVLRHAFHRVTTLAYHKKYGSVCMINIVVSHVSVDYSLNPARLYYKTNVHLFVPMKRPRILDEIA